MTPKQRIYLMADLWPAACHAQGWSPNDRARRLAELSAALGQPVLSASQIRTNADFDRVKRHLQTLAYNLRAAGESDHEGRARRLRHQIGEVIAALEDAGVDAVAYVAEVMRDKFRHGVIPAVERVGVEDLTAAPVVDAAGREHPSELDQLLITLTARLGAHARGPSPATCPATVHHRAVKPVSQPF